MKKLNELGCFGAMLGGAALIALTYTIEPSWLFGFGAILSWPLIFCLGASYGAMTQRGMVMARNGNVKEAGASCLVSLVTLPLFLPILGFSNDLPLPDKILFLTAASWLAILSLSGIWLIILGNIDKGGKQ